MEAVLWLIKSVYFFDSPGRHQDFKVRNPSLSCKIRISALFSLVQKISQIPFTDLKIFISKSSLQSYVNI